MRSSGAAVAPPVGSHVAMSWRGRCRGTVVMRVLVTWGSKRGGTEGIARIVGEALQHEGLDVDVLPARAAARATNFDAAIVGGALYANRWHPAARRFVNRQEKRLRGVPVWFFSSGPLDESAEHNAIAPTRQVTTLMERVGAQGHVTFGGRLTPDAHGFPASAMAKYTRATGANRRAFAFGPPRSPALSRRRAPEWRRLRRADPCCDSCFTASSAGRPAR
jgi:menaquinone-dependent protoporphyrinogen oxidase